MTSSPLRIGASLEDELDYYKRQYEQLETDLADFQASSKELEEQLERDIETAEKSERKLKEQVEKLNFEVEEWKTKHKQAKQEANNAQNVLQKEITTMRESHRTLQLKVRDIEVVNDDYERQARNTESSLEDLESKYNVAIERSVMLEEEMKNGDQEREALRIETQRLRDEFGDLKVESEITSEKLRLADETIERLRSRKPSPLAVEHLRARSPGSEASGITPGSPTASTPPPKSDSMSDAPTPPSPPLSDAPANVKVEAKTPIPPKRTSLLPDPAATPRLSLYGPRTAPRHSRGTSVASSAGTAASDPKAMRPPAAKPRQTSRTSMMPPEGLPRSDSLHQIKALRGRMQKIEERVHSARSKLPPAHTRTPTGSPRTGSALGNHIPASVTVRRSIKRVSGSAASSLQPDNGDQPASDRTTRRESQIKRLSYGIPRPSLGPPDRPASALERPPSAASASRPSSRASTHSAAPSSNRPMSRSGARTPLGQYAAGTTSTGTSTAGGCTAGGLGRPRSSLGGSFANNHTTTTNTKMNGTVRSHRPSASVSELRRKGSENSMSFAMSARRTTMEHSTLPVHSGLPRRQSGGIPQFSASTTASRRTSTGLQKGDGEMRPPPPTTARRKMSDVGETY